jgi:hypothetical protein
MALVLPVLIREIQTVLESQGSIPTDPAAAATLKASQLKLATGLATAIDSYIRQATVTVPPGIIVTTPSGPGITASPGTGTIS